MVTLLTRILCSAFQYVLFGGRHSQKQPMRVMKSLSTTCYLTVSVSYLGIFWYNKEEGLSHVHFLVKWEGKKTIHVKLDFHWFIVHWYNCNSPANYVMILITLRDSKNEWQWILFQSGNSSCAWCFYKCNKNRWEKSHSTCISICYEMSLPEHALYLYYAIGHVWVVDGSQSKPHLNHAKKRHTDGPLLFSYCHIFPNTFIAIISQW